MTIPQPLALEQLVEDKIRSGLYADESEVVCEALRHEFEQDAVSQWVQKQAAAGFAQLDAGDYADLTREDILAMLSNRRAA